MRYLVAVILVAMLTSPARAGMLTGQGLGATEKEAKAEALADLASGIEAEVRSEFTSLEGQIGKEEYQSVRDAVSVTTDLPILGARYEIRSTGGAVQARAILDSGVALPLYEQKLAELAENMKSAMSTAEGSKDEAAHEALGRMLTLSDQFNKYRSVAVALGARGPRISPPMADEEIRKRLQSFEYQFETLALGAKLAARALGQNKSAIYVYPPLAHGSKEVTPFASAFRDMLSAELNAAPSPKGAEYHLTGSYEIHEGGITMALRVSSSASGAPVASKLLTFSPAAYEKYDYRPRTASLEALLENGLAVSSEFRVQLGSTRGREALLYKKGEEFELMVKANRPGYFYIVGHVDRPEGRFSYLLELQDAQDKRRFVRFLNADDVNKWVSLGKFDIVPPFGVESLQLVASTGDLVERLPGVRLDQAEGLYIISRKPEEALVLTRALRPKKTLEVLSTEDVLTYTTMER